MVEQLQTYLARKLELEIAQPDGIPQLEQLTQEGKIEYFDLVDRNKKPIPEGLIVLTEISTYFSTQHPDRTAIIATTDFNTKASERERTLLIRKQKLSEYVHATILTDRIRVSRTLMGKYREAVAG